VNFADMMFARLLRYVGRAGLILEYARKTLMLTRHALAARLRRMERTFRKQCLNFVGKCDLGIEEIMESRGERIPAASAAG
jgi:hypothetical protein